MRRKREDELARELVPELPLEPFARRERPRIEALQVRGEEPCSPPSPILGQNGHPDSGYRRTYPFSVIPPGRDPCQPAGVRVRVCVVSSAGISRSLA